MEPEKLAPHYSRFRVSSRLLLSGHSHQAWPDVGFAAQQQAWLDAAEYVDDKWAHAEAHASRVREGFARLLGDAAPNIALGHNTHELVTRWLSSLPLDRRPRLVSTTGEFHSLRRQLDRLAEAGLEVVKVEIDPVDTLAERLAATVDARTAAAMVSSVLFESARIVPGLVTVAGACARAGADLLIDAYHHLNVVPFDLETMGLSNAFVTGGGYKYCQLGEGNCFLRVPPDTRRRPVLTGWFAEFEELERQPAARVRYGAGARAFGGATYDPTSHYRAAAVFAFHQEVGLTAARLREISQRQVALIVDAFDALDVDRRVAAILPMSRDDRGGFVAIRAARAGEIVVDLRARGVHADARGDILRLGPAPYLADRQLRDAVGLLGEVLRNVKVGLGPGPSQDLAPG